MIRLLAGQLDRLWKNTRDLSEMVENLENRGIDFARLKDNIDISSTAGRFFFNVMASLTQMERQLMLERTQTGLDAARLKNKIDWRRLKMTDSKVNSIKKLLAAENLPKDVAKDLGVSISTLCRWIPEENN